MNKQNSSSSFFYYTESGEPVYKVVITNGLERTYFVRNKRRHYEPGLPKKYYPFNLAAIIDAESSKVVYIVDDEAGAEALMNIGCLATCVVPEAYGGDFPKGWRGYLLDKSVTIINTTRDDCKQGIELAWEECRDFASSAQRLTLTNPTDGEEFGSSHVAEFISFHEMDAESWSDWIYKKLCDAKSAAESTDYKPTLDEMIEEEKEILLNGNPDKFESGWVPFPVEALPFAMREHTKEFSESLKVDPAYIALPSLVGAAGTIGNARVIRLYKYWCEPSVLFGCLVADSSTRKSPSMDWALRPISDMDFNLSRRSIEAQSKFKLEDFSWQSDYGGAPEVELNGVQKKRPAKPPIEKIIIGDITIETVIRDLEFNPRGLLMVRDELRAFFASMGRYKSSGAGSGDMAFWLEAYRASQWKYDRKSGDQTSVVIPRCAVSVFGTIQPTVLSKVFTRDYFESGFVSRILLALPPKQAGFWDKKEPSDETVMYYTLMMQRLRDLRGSFSESNECIPTEVLMSPEAEEVWAHFYNAGQKNQAQSEGEMAAMLSKMEGRCARLALILSVCDQVSGDNPTGLVEVQHMENAVKLSNWFIHEAQRVYAFCGKTEEEVDSDRIIEKIKHAGGFLTARELFLTNKPKFKSTDYAANLLNQLAANKKIEATDSAPGRKNTRNTTYYTTILR